MNEEQIQQIALEQIRPGEGNRRYGGFDPAKLQELAESIKAAGVLQPVLVRRNGYVEGLHNERGEQVPQYELVAGERRWRAAHIAGLEVLPCVVRELDDMQVLKIHTIENLQREDIHPLDEADGYVRLIDRAGYDVEHLAQEVGRSPSYVYQRLKLLELIPPARKMLVDGAIQAGHAILIARLQPAQQKEILGSYLFRRGEEVSVRQLDEFVREHILLDLARAAFKKDDPDLDAKAGPCTTCPKRTGYQPALFADVCNNGKRDYCTDPSCFNGKLEALVQRNRLQLKESGEKHLEVIDGHCYGVGWQEQQRLKKAGVKEPYEWEECKKTEERAVPCLVVAGPHRGRMTYGREREQNQRSSYKPTAEEQKARRREILEEKIKTATRRRIWDAVLAVLDVKKAFDDLPVELLRLIARKFWERTWQDAKKFYGRTMGWEPPPKKPGEYGEPWDRMGDSRISNMGAAELLRFMLTLSLAPELEGPGYNEPECKKLREIAAAYKLDVKGLAAEVRKGLTEKTKAREERAAKKASKANTAKKPKAKKVKASA